MPLALNWRRLSERSGFSGPHSAPLPASPSFMESNMDKLTIMTLPAAPHIAFGWFNLDGPGIAFWIAVIVVFVLFAWARIPKVMEADAASRREGGDL